MTETFPLIRTKLYRPRLQSDFIPRPQLLERLDRRRPLTLVSASAGYGKSTLVSSWVETIGVPCAWLSLDEYDNDLVVFLTYFLAAIQTMFPGAGKETLKLANATDLPLLRYLTASLINELDSIEEEYVLVLDDYHLIHESTIHDLLDELFLHFPRPMHLVLISRRDPPMDITRLRARGQVTEIRAQDLRFSEAEIDAFLEKLLGESVDQVTISFLEQKTDGWVTGLRLVALSMRHGDFLTIALERLSVDYRYAWDYLISEVYSTLPEPIRNFITKTAILDRLCGSLCDAVMELDEPECNGQAYLDWLYQANLFVIPLDVNQQWYRYHTLFQDLLRQKLAQEFPKEAIVSLHRRASAWFAENDFVEEAIHHSLIAGDIGTAVDLVAENRHNLIDQEQWLRLERWLRLFPREVIDSDPRMQIVNAWLYNVHGWWQEELAALALTESLLPHSNLGAGVIGPIQGEIHLMRANLLGWSYNGQGVLAQVEKALELLPRQWRYAYTSAQMIEAFGQYLTGQSERAKENLQRGLRDDQIDNIPHHKSLLLFGLAGLNWLNLDLREMRLVARHYHEHGQKYNLPETIAVAQYYLGSVCYQQNDLINAKRYFATVANTHYTVTINFKLQGVCGLALTYLALGKINQAHHLLDENQALLVEGQNLRLLALLKSCQVEVFLKQGRNAEVMQWAETYDPQPPVGLQLFYIPQLTWVKALLMQNTVASRKKAATMLAQLAEIARKAHLSAAVLAILPFQAALDDLQGDSTAALTKLKEAIDLAEAGGFIRLFVDLGPRMATLLEQLRNQGVSSNYIEQILAAFPIDEPTIPVGHQEALFEPLTNREIEVLELLAQRLSSKEIAAELYITPGTVRQHSHRIYQKLEVNGRQQAIVKAAELGILPDL